LSDPLEPRYKADIELDEAQQAQLVDLRKVHQQRVRQLHQAERSRMLKDIEHGSASP